MGGINSLTEELSNYDNNIDIVIFQTKDTKRNEADFWIIVSLTNLVTLISYHRLI